MVPVVNVRAHDFWDVFAGKDAIKLDGIVEEEWRGFSGGGDLGLVKKLIHGLPTSIKLLTDEDVPMVANAYSAIAVRMRENGGK